MSTISGTCKTPRERVLVVDISTKRRRNMFHRAESPGIRQCISSIDSSVCNTANNCIDEVGLSFFEAGP